MLRLVSAFQVSLEPVHVDPVRDRASKGAAVVGGEEARRGRRVARVRGESRVGAARGEVG
jgi:hypothetical protein